MINIKKKKISYYIRKLKKKILEIEKYKITKTKKTKIYKKIANNFKKKINKNISLNTYISYISRARKQFIKIKHHFFKKKIKILKKKFKYFKKEINSILKNKKIKNIFLKIKKINKKLINIDLLIKSLNKIKIYSKKNKEIIKKTIKKIPEWKKETEKLIKEPWFKSNKKIINKIQEGKILFKKLKKLKINHEILFHLKVGKRKFNLFKKISYQNLKNKKKNTIIINYKNYIQNIYNILTTNINFNNINEIASLSFCLSAISGRRMIEIIKTGKFKISKNKEKIKFKGQAKKNKKEYYIYILIFSNIFFIKKINDLRNSKIIKNIINKTKKKKYISQNQQISNYLSPPFNKWVKTFFKNKKITYKDSRSIYSSISLKKWFKKEEKWKKYDEDMFLYKILGHTNIYSQIYYKKFKILNYLEKWEPKKQKNIRYINLCNIDQKIQEKIIKRKKTYRIHNITKNIIKKQPNKIINNYILRKFGFNTILIQKYIKYISKYISQEKKNNRYILKNKQIKKIIYKNK